MTVCSTIFQQTFCLSMQICSAAKDKGDAQSLAATLGSNLQSLYDKDDFANGDNWSTVWGPVVWQAPFSDVVDQAVAVAYNATLNYHIVAISATNSYSAYDVFFEDLAAAPQYLQDFAAIKDAQLSAGNSSALQAIAGMTSGGKTLQQFLDDAAAGKGTLVFCGHSLGGGLTPLVAALCYPDGKGSSSWDAVYTYGSAGPATANAAFAKHFNNAYPATTIDAKIPYAIWNANQYNREDIVPNAWAPGDSGPGLAQITASLVSANDAMFFTSLAMQTAIIALRTMAKSLAGGDDNPYVAVNNNGFFSDNGGSDRITADQELSDSILYRHIKAYMQAFGVTSLFSGQDIASMIQPPLRLLVDHAIAARKAMAAAQPAERELEGAD